MLSRIRKLVKNEKGATAIEYALIVALISVAAVVVYGQVGSGIDRAMGSVKDKLPAAPAT